MSEALIKTPGGAIVGIETAISMLGAKAPALNSAKAKTVLSAIKAGTNPSTTDAPVSEQVA